MRRRWKAISLTGVVILAMAGNASGQRIDRNLERSTAPGEKIPALETSAIKVSKGARKVKIGFSRNTLETLTATPPGDGPFPVAVISHGVPRKSKHRKSIRLRHLLPIAEDFARRGYKAVIVARRGFASSSGSYAEGYGKCRNVRGANYVRAARNSAKDYAAVIRALSGDPDVDGERIIAVGQSGGGLAVTALARETGIGLIGVISFAAGRGSRKDGENCNEAGLVSAFGTLGKKAKVPTLWLSSTTDRFFGPELVDRAFEAYAKNGAPVRLERVGALWFREDGHQLVRLGGRELWRPRIDAFLETIGAPSWTRAPDNASVARLGPPTGLSARGRKSWKRYLEDATHKAFASAPSGAFAWVAARETAKGAQEEALERCRKRDPGCRIVDTNARGSN